MADPRPVPRWLRAFDALALLLLLGGAALYVRAWAGMQRMHTAEPAPGAEPFATMDRYLDLLSDARIALALVGAAVGLAVLAAAARVLLERRADARAARAGAARADTVGAG